MAPPTFTRRTALKLFGTGITGLMLPSVSAFAADGERAVKLIPGTEEKLPAIGMGTWQTFNVGNDRVLRNDRTEVLRALFAGGGGVIDSSPMYGTSEETVGWCLRRLDDTDGLVSATKVWTPAFQEAEEQMAASRRLWGVETFDVMQVHNLVDWKKHLETLRRHKDEGKIRHIGVTTSHGRRHDELEKIMRREPIDFVQLTYNIIDRWAEDRLLPLARDKGLGVIINRPFKHKELFHRFGDEPLPPWAAEVDCANWAQFFLKFIVSHPAVTCAIPATSQIPHMKENMGALYGRLPDEAMRRRMVRYVEGL
jgi:diketogulonate reductase-like aldo/keto reductase